MTSQLHLQYLLYATDGPRTSALINIQCVLSDAKILCSVKKKSIRGSQSVGRGPQGGTQQLQGRDGGMVVGGGC